MTPQETVDLITRLISNLGFPVFVAVWLLWRTEPALKGLTTAVNKLADKMGEPHNGIEARAPVSKEV